MASLASALAGERRRCSPLAPARASAPRCSPRRAVDHHRRVPGAERANALGVWGAVGGAGAAIGVLLGGALTELVDWRAIFFINLPIGLALAAAATKYVPPDAAPPRRRGLDVRGALVATASVGGLVYAASQAQDAGWTSMRTLGIGAAALAGLAGFALLEPRTAQPAAARPAAGRPRVGGGFLMMLTVSAVLFGSFLLSSLYLQSVLGTGALATGLAFLPLAVAIGAGVHVAGHVISHAGVRLPLAGGFAVTAAGMLLLSGVGASGSYVADVLPACWSPASASGSSWFGLGLRAHRRRATRRPECSRG